MTGVTVDPPHQGTSLTLRPRDWATLSAQLRDPKNGRQGAVMLAQRVDGPRGARFLGRQILHAEPGSDPASGGGFARGCADRARREHLSYLAFSNVLSDAHLAPADAPADEAISTIAEYTGQPALDVAVIPSGVSGVVINPDGTRGRLAELVVPGHNLLRIQDGGHDSDPRSDEAAEQHVPHLDSRQLHLFSEEGQAVLNAMRVAVVGLGSVGGLLVASLTQLGVGSLVLIDNDIVTVHNFPYIAGATIQDLDSSKTALAARNARRAQPGMNLRLYTANVREQGPRAALARCDWIFLAANSQEARHRVNEAVERFLIPGTRVGTERPGDGLVQTVTQRLVPGAGCLQCNGLIDPVRLELECASPGERGRADEPDQEGPPSSAFMLNAVAVAVATNDFSYAVTNLHPVASDERASMYADNWATPHARPHRDDECAWCGDGQGRRS